MFAAPMNLKTKKKAYNEFKTKKQAWLRLAIYQRWADSDNLDSEFSPAFSVKNPIRLQKVGVRNKTKRTRDNCM